MTVKITNGFILTDAHCINCASITQDIKTDLNLLLNQGFKPVHSFQRITKDSKTLIHFVMFKED